MNERQRLLALHEHAVEEDAKLMDVFNCVERLHELEPRKYVTADRNDSKFAKVPRFDKPPSKVSVTKLFYALPRHIMACILAKQPTNPPDTTTRQLTSGKMDSTSYFDHVSKAFSLLAALSPICLSPGNVNTDGTSTAAMFRPGSEFTTQLVDAVIMALLAVAAPEADAIIKAAKAGGPDMQGALDRASIVPTALKALVLVVSGPLPPASLGEIKWDAVCETLFNHPRGALAMDALFDAARVLVAAVREAMCGPAEVGSVYQLAFHTGGAMEFATYLCATPLFYQRMMRHDSSGSVPLRLVLECLALHDAPLACPPFKRLSAPGADDAARPVLAATTPPYSTNKGKGSAELLAARGFALLVLLGEYDDPSYMDELCNSPNSKALAERIVSRAAAYIGQVLLRPRPSAFPAASGESQMAINVLRAAELLSDDSNFRGPLIKGLAPTIAQLVQQPDENAFMSLWVGGEEAIRYHAKDDILINSVTMAAMKGVNRCSSASKTHYQSKNQQAAAMKNCGITGESLKLGRHLALERAILLTKLLVNLHFWSDEVNNIGEKDEFVNELITHLKASNQGPVSLSHAVHNVSNLFTLAREFGMPNCKPDHEMMNDADMEFSDDLLTKLNAALTEVKVATSQQPQQQPQQVPQQPQPNQQQLASRANPPLPSQTRPAMPHQHMQRPIYPPGSAPLRPPPQSMPPGPNGAQRPPFRPDPAMMQQLRARMAYMQRPGMQQPPPGMQSRPGMQPGPGMQQRPPMTGSQQQMQLQAMASMIARAQAQQAQQPQGRPQQQQQQPGPGSSPPAGQQQQQPSSQQQ